MQVTMQKLKHTCSRAIHFDVMKRSHVTTEFHRFQSRNFDVYRKNELTYLSVNGFQCAQGKSLQPPKHNSTCLLILNEIGREMTILQKVEVVVISMPYFGQSLRILCGYCTNMKLMSKGFQCFREVQVKNDFTDNS